MWQTLIVSERAHHIAPVMSFRSPKVGRVVPAYVGGVSGLGNDAVPSRLCETAVPPAMHESEASQEGQEKYRK